MDLMLLDLTPDFTDDQLRACICQIYPRVSRNGAGAIFCINGFDDDPREIWEIPECVDLMKRCVDVGFISILEVSTGIPELSSLKLPQGTKPPGFGALEVWLAATGQLNTGDTDLSMSLIRDEFFPALSKSNEQAAQVMSESHKYVDFDPLRIREFNPSKRPPSHAAYDGQNRFRGPQS